MKINEVVTEASFLNRLGAGIKGAVAGFQQSRSNNLRKDVRQQSLQKELADWKRDMNAMRSKVNLSDPAEFQKVLHAWANARYPEATVGGVDAVDVSTVRPNDNNAIQKYISGMFNAAMDNVGKVPTKPTKSATPPGPGGLPTLTSGVQVVSTARPIVLRWKKNDFALTNANTWVYFGSAKQASPEMSAFLTKNLEEL